MFYEKSVSGWSPNPAQGPLPIWDLLSRVTGTHTYIVTRQNKAWSQKGNAFSLWPGKHCFHKSGDKENCLYVKLSTCVNTVEKPAIRFIDKRLYLLVTFYT